MIFSDDGYTVLVDGVKVELLRKEFLLLKFLYMNNGRAFSREELLMPFGRTSFRQTVRWMIIFIVLERNLVRFKI